MQNKLIRFAIYAVIMTAILFLALMLLDLREGSFSEKAPVNLIIAAIIGVSIPAFMVFWRKPDK
jgi:hypothetical protein